MAQRNILRYKKGSENKSNIDFLLEKIKSDALIFVLVGTLYFLHPYINTKQSL